MNPGSHIPRRVKRCVLLVEMADGMQIGYQVAGSTVDATITFDPPQFDPRWDEYARIPSQQYGEISCRGIMTGLMRMPANVFTDDPALTPATPELEPPR